MRIFGAPRAPGVDAERRRYWKILGFGSLGVALSAAISVLCATFWIHNTTLSVQAESGKRILEQKVATLEQEILRLREFERVLDGFSASAKGLDLLESEIEESKKILATIEASLRESAKSIRSKHGKDKKRAAREIAKITEESSSQARTVRKRIGEAERERDAVRGELANRLMDKLKALNSK